MLLIIKSRNCIFSTNSLTEFSRSPNLWISTHSFLHTIKIFTRTITTSIKTTTRLAGAGDHLRGLLIKLSNFYNE